MSNTRTIHTGLYGKTARDILQAMFGRIHYIHRSKANTTKTKNTLQTELKVADDNEVLLELGEIYSRKEWKYLPAWSSDGLTEKDMYDHFTWYIKRIAMFEMAAQDVGRWKRDCEDAVTINPPPCGAANECNTATVKVRDIYFIYDYLKGRKWQKRYDAEVAKAIIGQPLDPISTEMKIAQREEANKLRVQLADKIRELERERYLKIEEARNEVYRQYDKLIAETKAETARKIKEIEEMVETPMAALLTSAALGA